MTAAAPLLGDNDTRWPRLRAALDAAPVKAFLDWAPLILFYVLDGALPFGVASAVALFAGVLCMSMTHLRSKLDARVSSPKVLDVGFVVTFAAFTVAGFASAQSAHVTIMWANALMDAALAAIVAAGVALDEPFTLPYAVEMGMPLEIARTPFILRVLRAAALEWCYVFAAMAAVSGVAPFYRCAVVGTHDGAGCLAPSNATYRVLNATFTYGAQYAILGVMFAKSFWLDPRKERLDAEFVRRAPEAYAAEHGVPALVAGATARDGASVALRALQDDRLAPAGDADVERAAATLASAFLNDPFFKLWVCRAQPELEDDERARLAVSRVLFAVFVRLCRRFNHGFEVGDGDSYCICVPCWPRGDELKRTLQRGGFDTFMDGIQRDLAREKSAHPDVSFELGSIFFPPLEFATLEKITEHALRGRPHLYVFLFATEPSKQGQGLGSIGMRAALSIADERGVPTVLETMTCANVRIYEHLGFVVAGQIEVDGCEDPWFSMIREPPTPTAGKAGLV